MDKQHERSRCLPSSLGSTHPGSASTYMTKKRAKSRRGLVVVEGEGGKGRSNF